MPSSSSHPGWSLLPVSALTPPGGRCATSGPGQLLFPHPLVPVTWGQTGRYVGVGWRVGPNYVPNTAVNAVQMWQANHFDPVAINRELQWAARARS